MKLLLVGLVQLQTNTCIFYLHNKAGRNVENISACMHFERNEDTWKSGFLKFYLLSLYILWDLWVSQFVPFYRKNPYSSASLMIWFLISLFSFKSRWMAICLLGVRKILFIYRFDASIISNTWEEEFGYRNEVKITYNGTESYFMLGIIISIIEYETITSPFLLDDLHKSQAAFSGQVCHLPPTLWCLHLQKILYQPFH